jgi:hypothetical protein
MSKLIRYEELPALLLSNDILDVTVLLRGTSIVNIALRDDPEQLSPLWNPQKVAREHGEPKSAVFPLSPGMGHFVCVDGFGPCSAEEQAAGFPMHGEAHQQLFSVDEDSSANGVLTVKMSASLPLSHEKFTRTLRLAGGENVVSVESELENELAFDRPAVWAEHATVAPPFLEPGVTVVDMPAARSMTKPYTTADDPPQRLESGEEFDWPMAPAVGGKIVDLRSAGTGVSGDHTASLMDPERPYGYVTILNPKRQLLLGYIFRQSEFPFVQNWEYYPANGHLARGLEFSTQPWDCPRRESIGANPTLGAPTFRWLGAKARIASRFLMFWTRVPESLTGVRDVRLENGDIVVTGDPSETFTLKTSFSL